MEKFQSCISSKSIAMTNKEILQADLLDILFEHRNKLYGAYTLRKNYSQRLGTALGLALSIVLLFILMSFMNDGKKNRGSFNDAGPMIITEVDIPKQEIKEPDPPRNQPTPPRAEVDYQQFKIVKDDDAGEQIAELKDIVDAEIGDENIEGAKSDDIARSAIEGNGNGNGSAESDEKEDDKPVLTSRPPEFPGGTEAWLAFLQRFLQSPEELEAGRRIEVQVRFWVGIDGSVSNPEVIKSGGKSFDMEVLRVLKKMPPWEPAIQNGVHIAVAYTQPVIFIGAEE
jgi:protein TonB